MASTSNNNSSLGSLCLDKCGFFASTEGRCSKCYRDWKAKQATNTHSTTTSTSSNGSKDVVETAALLSPLTSPSLSASINNSPQASPLLLPQQTEITKMEDFDVNLSTVTTTESKQVEQPVMTVAANTLQSVVEQPTTEKLFNAPQQSIEASSTSTTTSASASSSSSSSTSSPTKPSSKIRCVSCSKKLSAMSYFSCKCDSTLHFCATHRYPHAHQCTFDHKNQQKNNLQKSVFLVKDRQIEKI